MNDKPSQSDKQFYANLLLDIISDEKFKSYVLMCVELLATKELTRDVERATRAAYATVHEFRKEVSEALLSAMAFNLARGAYADRDDDMARTYTRVFEILQNDRGFFDVILHLATFAQVLAPACKREAEFIEAQIRESREKLAQMQPTEDSDPKR